MKFKIYLISSFLLLAITAFAQWTKYGDAPRGVDFTGLAYKDGVFYAASFNNGTYTKAEGESEWVRIGNEKEIQGLHAHGDYFFCYRNTNIYDELVRSSDGISWSNANLTNLTFYGMGSHGNTLFVSASNGTHKTSDNGVTWTDTNNPITFRKFKVISDTLYAGGTGGLYYYQADSNTWKLVHGQSATNFEALNDSTFLLIANGAVKKARVDTTTSAYSQIGSISGAILDFFYSNDTLYMISTKNMYAYLTDSIQLISSLDENLNVLARGTSEVVAGSLLQRLCLRGSGAHVGTCSRRPLLCQDI